MISGVLIGIVIGWAMSLPWRYRARESIRCREVHCERVVFPEAEIPQGWNR